MQPFHARASSLRRASSRGLAAVALVVSLLACATDIRGHVEPVTLNADVAAPSRITIREAIRLVPSGSVAPADVRAGSTWELVGRIDRGDVYRPVDTVLQLRTGHSAEAYLVIRERTVVGCYVPHARGYLALDEPASLDLVERKDP